MMPPRSGDGGASVGQGRTIGTTEYAEHRAALLHKLVDESGVAVDSWGETDSAYPREVVEIVHGLGPTAIATFGVVLAALVSRPRKAEPVLPTGPEPPP